eukprot:CAMPEP_0179968628 /NCGR_PEP_ID=MMETSP0983-20121128/34008_1 /TAXON_ID=483367 /ORGANISM="non described non described, Strain CCMP 2436" /LENGTH=183 /DNA_ID=CAMNT_0021882523 /DNA_START=70 /DNA_END=618 /DNA_ORIENTATION=-
MASTISSPAMLRRAAPSVCVQCPSNLALRNAADLRVPAPGLSPRAADADTCSASAEAAAAVARTSTRAPAGSEASGPSKTPPDSVPSPKESKWPTSPPPPFLAPAYSELPLLGSAAARSALRASAIAHMQPTAPSASIAIASSSAESSVSSSSPLSSPLPKFEFTVTAVRAAASRSSALAAEW